MMAYPLKNPAEPIDNGRCGAEEVLFQLQLEQFEHDEKYHREIARLSVHHRLNHMALHFAKYAGKLIEFKGEPKEVEKTVTDTFIIALSCANILNFKIWDKIRPQGYMAAEDLEELGWQLQTAVEVVPEDTDTLIRQVTVAAGRMAAACEKVDHLEPYPFRETIEQSVASLATSAIVVAVLRSWGLAGLVRNRLSFVKEKSILHGHI